MMFPSVLRFPTSVSESRTRSWVESRSWSGNLHSMSNWRLSRSSIKIGLTDEEALIKKVLDE